MVGCPTKIFVLYSEKTPVSFVIKKEEVVKTHAAVRTPFSGKLMKSPKDYVMGSGHGAGFGQQRRRRLRLLLLLEVGGMWLVWMLGEP